MRFTCILGVDVSRCPADWAPASQLARSALPLPLLVSPAHMGRPTDKATGIGNAYSMACCTGRENLDNPMGRWWVRQCKGWVGRHGRGIRRHDSRGQPRGRVTCIFFATRKQALDRGVDEHSAGVVGDEGACEQYCKIRSHARAETHDYDRSAGVTRRNRRERTASSSLIQLLRVIRGSCSGCATRM